MLYRYDSNYARGLIHILYSYRTAHTVLSFLTRSFVNPAGNLSVMQTSVCVRIIIMLRGRNYYLLHGEKMDRQDNEGD